MTAKSLTIVILKRVLDALILLFLISIPIILITGGIKVEVFGATIKAMQVLTPLKYLIPLALIRVLISTQLKNALLLFASVTFALVVAEMAIRVWAPAIAKPGWIHLHKKSRQLAWELVPGAAGVGKFGERYQISADGLRDRDYPLEKPQGVIRIAAIGDSFTFGMGVNLEDSYPKQLEGILSAQGAKVEVMDFGVIGHNMWQHYAMLNTRVLRYHPDLVVLGLFTDDIQESVPPYATSPNYQGKNPFGSDANEGILSYSALLNFVDHANDLFEYKYRYRKESYMKNIPERKKVMLQPGNPMYVIMSGGSSDNIVRRFHKALEDFVIRAKRAGAEVLTVYIPDSVQLNEPRLQASNRLVANISRESGATFVDTTPVLEAQSNIKDLYLFPFDAHNSPRGYSVIAQAIADKILSAGLVRGL